MNYFNETQNPKYDKSNMQMGTDNCTYSSSVMDMPGCGCAMMPIYECPQERVQHRFICYDVPHIMPCNTKIINHHIYRHTYQPLYTYCEENVCENVYERGCC